MVMILICHPLGIYHHYHPLLFGPQPVMCVKGSRLGLGEKIAASFPCLDKSKSEAVHVSSLKIPMNNL